MEDTENEIAGKIEPSRDVVKTFSEYDSSLRDWINQQLWFARVTSFCAGGVFVVALLLIFLRM